MYLFVAVQGIEPRVSGMWSKHTIPEPYPSLRVFYIHTQRGMLGIILVSLPLFKGKFLVERNQLNLKLHHFASF